MLPPHPHTPTPRMQGCHVTVISTSEGKRAEALGTLGADAFINSKDPEAIKVCVCAWWVGGALQQTLHVNWLPTSQSIAHKVLHS